MLWPRRSARRHAEGFDHFDGVALRESDRSSASSQPELVALVKSSRGNRVLVHEQTQSGSVTRRPRLDVA